MSRDKASRVEVLGANKLRFDLPCPYITHKV